MTAVCECSVDMGADEAEPASVSKERHIKKARKEHVCNECGETIRRGEGYDLITGISDGTAFTHKVCVPCRRIIADLCPCGWVLGMLREAIWESLGFDYVTGDESP